MFMKKIYPKKSKGHWKDHKSAGHEGGKKFGAHGGWQGGTQRHVRGTIHQALCSSCAAPCEVPFKPNGKKPIFCHTCFRKNSGHTSKPRESTHDFDRQQTFGKPTRSQTS